MQSKKKSDKSLQQKKMKDGNVGTRLNSKDIQHYSKMYEVN